MSYEHAFQHKRSFNVGTNILKGSLDERGSSLICGKEKKEIGKFEWESKFFYGNLEIKSLISYFVGSEAEQNYFSDFFSQISWHPKVAKFGPPP